MAAQLTYAVVTPVRDEAENLPRLGRSLAAQTLAPKRWLIVDTGSTDDTVAVVRKLAAELPFVRFERRPADEETVQRGAPIVRAFEHGVDQLVDDVDIVAKLDADVSFEPDYFARLLAEFAGAPSLGIASGSAEELDAGRWHRRYNTGSSVWGASRAYRRECLEEVRPLERGMGWDGIDEVRAHLRGWTTRTVPDLTFRHHRVEGRRDGRRWRAWLARGKAAHYMGYRAWYLALRALHHARREPAALAMIVGFVAAMVTRRPVCPDGDIRAYLRRGQTLGSLRTRRREALGAQGR